MHHFASPVQPPQPPSDSDECLGDERRFVEDWIKETLGHGYQAPVLTAEQTSALFFRACAHKAQMEFNKSSDRRVAEIDRIALEMESSLAETYGVKPAGLPAAVELAKGAAELGLVSPDPGAICSKLVDIQGEVFALSDTVSSIRVEKEELKHRLVEVEELEAMLEGAAKEWEEYLAEREEEAEEHREKAAMHLEKVSEYNTRQEQAVSRLAAIGMTSNLEHGALMKLHADVERLTASIKGKKAQLAKYTVPPNSNTARARVAQAQAELQHLKGPARGGAPHPRSTPPKPASKRPL
eukprot:Sspe_Gene.97910::Locus_71401_Transcript_1_1_Confidence_1.000_Length_964::g.97910::m.97910